jgi:YbbR domain-containing protein
MQFLKHNWFLKVAALAAAIVLATYVHRESDLVRTTYPLPLTLDAPPGLRVVEPLPGAPVTVSLEGPADLMRTITMQDLKVTVDISNVPPERRRSVPIDITLPEKYEERVLVDWRPRSVQVRLESDARKELSITVKPLNPPDGWELPEVPRADPPRVTINGTRDAVNRVATVEAPFSLEASEHISTIARLQALDRDGNPIPEELVRLEPAQVSVEGIQERVVLQKRVPVQPMLRIRDGSRVKVESITPSEVQVQGPKRLVGELYVLETESIVLAGGGAGGTKELMLLVPQGVEVTPRTVTVKFKTEAPPSR